MDSTTTVKSAGVDWLTCSAPTDGNGGHLRELGVELLMENASKGNKVRPFKRGTYQGGGTNHVGVGEYQGRVLVELSGALADEWYEELLPLADRVSRIDLQVSVHQAPYDTRLALRTWARASVLAEQEGRRPDYDLYARKGAGTTLYIGEGASRYRARLYERWWKEKIPENQDVWRYEVQARRERALQLAALLQRSHDGPAFTQALVYSHFQRRGVTPIYAPGATVAVPPVPAPPTDKDKSLAWLRQSVRPVIERLANWGAGEEALRALNVGTIDVE